MRLYRPLKKTHSRRLNRRLRLPVDLTEPTGSYNRIVNVLEFNRKVHAPPRGWYSYFIDSLVRDFRSLTWRVPRPGYDEYVTVWACSDELIRLQHNFHGVVTTSHYFIEGHTEYWQSNWPKFIVLGTGFWVRRYMDTNRPGKLIFYTPTNILAVSAFVEQFRQIGLKYFHKAEDRVITKPWGKLQKDRLICTFVYDSVNVYGTIVASGEEGRQIIEQLVI